MVAIITAATAVLVAGDKTDRALVDGTKVLKVMETATELVQVSLIVLHFSNDKYNLLAKYR